MSNSSLVTVNVPAHSGNYTKNRAAQGGKISAVTIHHMAGNLSAARCGAIFQAAGRKGSTHYGVSGNDVGQYVDEANVAWANSNWKENCRSVTIETANSASGGDWPVSDTTLATLIRLVADIAKRNGLGKLVVGSNLTYHSMFAATACPGPYLKSKLQYIADKANAINGAASAPAPAAPAPAPIPAPTAGARKVGDVVEFNGVYVSSTSTQKLNPAVRKGRIVRIIASARNPYLVESIGWVNNAVIVGATVAPAPAGSAIKAGSKVTVVSPIIYGTNKTFKLYYKVYDVIQLNGDRAVIGIGKTVSSAISVSNLRLA
jgi:hypothetical protein